MLVCGSSFPEVNDELARAFTHETLRLYTTEDRLGLPGVRRREDAIAFIEQSLRGEFAHGRLVLDHEDGGGGRREGAQGRGDEGGGERDHGGNSNSPGGSARLRCRIAGATGSDDAAFAVIASNCLGLVSGSLTDRADR